MATTPEFMQFVYDQVKSAGDISYKKMFGEYMLYCDGRPVLLICDNTVYVKQLPDVATIFSAHDVSVQTGIPYTGAREHYILDTENVDLAIAVVRKMAQILPVPKPRSHRGTK